MTERRQAQTSRAWQNISFSQRVSWLRSSLKNYRWLLKKKKYCVEMSLLEWKQKKDVNKNNLQQHKHADIPILVKKICYSLGYKCVIWKLCWHWTYCNIAIDQIRPFSLSRQLDKYKTNRGEWVQKQMPVVHCMYQQRILRCHSSYLGKNSKWTGAFELVKSMSMLLSRAIIVHECNVFLLN